MKSLFALLLVSFVPVISLQSQSFTIAASQNPSVVRAGEAVKYAIKVNPVSGFNASVFLKATSPVLKSLVLSTDMANSPYAGITLTVRPDMLDTGDQIIIVEGKNGPSTDTDTIRLHVVNNSFWKTYKSGITGLTFDHNNKLYGTSKYKPVFLGRLQSDTFAFTQPWENYVEGPSDSRAMMTIDKDNYPWVGSFGKIGRFDGTYWTVYKLNPTTPNPDQIIYDISTDSSGNIWYLCTPWMAQGQYSSYLGVMKDGEHLKTDSLLKNALNTNNNRVVAIRHESIEIDSEGNVWLAAMVTRFDQSISYEILKYDGNSWLSVPLPGPEIEMPFIYNTKTYLSINPTGGVWLTFQRYTSSGITYSEHEYVDSAWHNSTFSLDGTVGLFFDYSGRACKLKGDTLLRWEDSQWQVYNLAEVIPSGTLRGITIDRCNNIWLSHSSQTFAGITVYNPQGISNQIVLTGLEADTSLFEANDDNFSISPNPTQNSTTIYYSLKTESQVSISIYNSLGIEVFKSDLGFKNVGDNSETISTSDMPSGQYYYVLKAGAQQSTQPLVIVR